MYDIVVNLPSTNQLAALITLVVLLVSFPEHVDFGPPSVSPLYTGYQAFVADPFRQVVYEAGFGVEILDETTLALVDTIQVNDTVNALDLSADGNFLYASTNPYQGTPQIFQISLNTRLVVQALNVSFSPHSLRVGRSDRMYVSQVGGSYLHILNWTSGQEIGNLSVWEEVLLETNPSGARLVLVGDSVTPTTMYLYDITTDTPTLLGQDHHDLWMTIPQFAVDWTRGRVYLPGSFNGYGAEVITLPDITLSGVLLMKAYPYGVAISPDGQFVYGLTSGGGWPNSLYVFNVSDPGSRNEVPLSRDTNGGLLVSGDGQFLYSLDPLWRLPTPPDVDPRYPSPDSSQDTSPANISASVWLGLPAVQLTDFALTLDEMPLPARFAATTELRASLNASLMNGYRTVRASIDWSNGNNSVTWSFTNAQVPPLIIYPWYPSIYIGLNYTPDYMRARTFATVPNVELNQARTTLDGQLLITRVLSQSEIQADIAWNLSAGEHVVAIWANTSAGDELAIWTLVIGPEPPFPPLEFFPDSNGFNISVPSGWARRYNAPVLDRTYSLVLQGPSKNGYATTIAIGNFSDPKVGENSTYLASFVNRSLALAVGFWPSAYLLGVAFREVSGHTAVDFEIRDPSCCHEERIVAIADEGRGRVWLIVLAVHESFFGWANTTLERMVRDIHIESAPSEGGLPSALPAVLVWGIVAIVIVAAVVFVALVVRKRRALPPSG